MGNLATWQHARCGEAAQRPGAEVVPIHSASTSDVKPAEAILGPVDALKLRSSMQIFAEAAPDEPLFQKVLAAAG